MGNGFPMDRLEMKSHETTLHSLANGREVQGKMRERGEG
jgi:hypothetical protein